MVGALFLLAISSLSAVLSLRVKPVARGIQSRLHSLSLGSDLIERPDDENSPEFRVRLLILKSKSLPLGCIFLFRSI